MRKAVAAVLVVVVLVVSIIALTMLKDPTESEGPIVPLDSPELPERGYFMGVLPIPHTDQSFADAYLQVAEHAEFVPMWGKPSPFYAMAGDLSGSWGKTFVTDYTRGNGMFPLVHFSFFGGGITLTKPPGMDDATLSDPEWREAYKESVLDTVMAVKPLYLSVGNEVNRWYEKYGADAADPNGFQHFISLYEEIFDAVKEVSNQTVVFCVFAREIVSENREADLSVLGMFDEDRMDLLAFTSYVHAVQGINSPNDVPDDYYSRALTHMPGKKMAFTELGWPSIEFFGGQAGQAEYLSDVAGRLTIEQGVELHMLAWAWLHDLDENDETGLIEHDGTEKLAYEVWKDLSAGS